MPSADSTSNPVRDAAVVGRVLNGDVEAYAELIAAYRGRCLRYATRMLGDRDEAEDVAQEAFVRAFQALAQCRRPEGFGAWLFRILINRCRTVVKRQQQWRMIVLREAETGVWIDEAPDEAILDAPLFENWDAVQRALARLKPAQREAFVLKYVDEMSYEEMVVLTGRSIPALKMRVSRACEALRATLGGTYHAHR